VSQLPLGSRAFDILVYSAERPGEVIGKKELIDHVWWDVSVEEGSLRVHVSAIRKALRDGQFGNRYIANVKGEATRSLERSFVSKTARNTSAGGHIPRELSERPPEKHQLRTLVLGGWVLVLDEYRAPAFR